MIFFFFLLFRPCFYTSLNGQNQLVTHYCDLDTDDPTCKDNSMYLTKNDRWQPPGSLSEEWVTGDKFFANDIALGPKTLAVGMRRNDNSELNKNSVFIFNEGGVIVEGKSVTRWSLQQVALKCDLKSSKLFFTQRNTHTPRFINIYIIILSIPSISLSSAAFCWKRFNHR